MTYQRFSRVTDMHVYARVVAAKYAMQLHILSLHRFSFVGGEHLEICESTYRYVLLPMEAGCKGL